MERQTLPRYLSLTIFVGFMILGATHLLFGGDMTLEPSTFLTYHTLLGMMSGVFALAIFLTFFSTQEIRRLKYNLILGNTFLITGILDFLSVMSLPGMPFTFSGNPETAAWLWLLSRLVFGMGLVWSFHLSREETTDFSKEHALIFSFLIMLIIIILSTQGPVILPKLYSATGSFTPFKLSSAMITLLLHFFAIIRYTENLKVDMSPGRFSMLLGLWLAVFSEFAFGFYQVPNEAMLLVGHGLKLVGVAMMFRAVFMKNVRLPYLSLYEQSEGLRYSVSDLQSAVETGTWEIRRQNDLLAKANEKLQLDLVATKAIQEAVFPTESENFGELSFHFEINPVDELSGDYINYYAIDEDHIAFYIMDVAGHGVTAAMLGILAQNAVAESIRREARDVNRIMPDQVLKQLFQIYNQSPFPDEVHLVMLFGIYHRDSQEVVLSTAGLNVRPILIPKGKAPQYVDLAGGFPICRLAEFVTPLFENQSIPMLPGDKLLIYTDGLLDMAKPSWGEAGLFEFVRQQREASGEVLRKELRRLVHDAHETMEQVDDISFAILEKF